MKITAGQVTRLIREMEEPEFQKLVSMVWRAQRDNPHKTYDIADRGAIYHGLCLSDLQPVTDS